jgi:hypothetical protein
VDPPRVRLDLRLDLLDALAIEGEDEVVGRAVLDLGEVVDDDAQRRVDDAVLVARRPCPAG